VRAAYEFDRDFRDLITESLEVIELPAVSDSLRVWLSVSARGLYVQHGICPFWRRPQAWCVFFVENSAIFGVDS